MADSFIPLKFKIDGSGNPTAWSEYAAGDTQVMPGSVNLTGNSRRIMADFSNSTANNRAAIQTSEVNGATNVAAIPNGTGVQSTFITYNSTDLSNASRVRLSVDNLLTQIISDQSGSGSFLPFAIQAGGAERVRFLTAGGASYNTPLKFQPYTLSTLPSASAFNSYCIEVSDATGGPKVCRSNGSVWQILNTTTTVS